MEIISHRGFSVSALREMSVSSEHDDATLDAVLPSLVSCYITPSFSDIEIDSTSNLSALLVRQMTISMDTHKTLVTCQCKTRKRTVK